jgi:hypothetical protein
MSRTSDVQTFCSSLLRHQVKTEGVLALEVFSRSVYGICLVIDICGFTALSAELCTKGRDGFNELQLIINSFLDLSADLIEEFDGDGNRKYAML